MKKLFFERLKKTVFACALSSCITVPSLAQEKGWTPLFDGKTLNGWKVLAGKAKYTVEDGAIVGSAVPNTGNTFLVTENEYGDFIFEVDVKIQDTAFNSGIQTRSHYDAAGNNGSGKVFGRQVEIDPSSRRFTAGIYDEGRRGWLYPLSYNPAAANAFKVGEFNTIRIECSGDETRTLVNGVPTAYVIDTVDRKGFIGLQVHSIHDASLEGARVYFKNIRIKTGKSQPDAFKDIFVVNLQNNILSDFEKKSGYKLLFNGRNSEGWQSARGPSFPSSGWKIQNGMLTVLSSEGKESANGGDIITVDKFSAFDLSFAFRLTPGANSGVKYFVTLKETTDGSAIGLEYQLLDDTLHPDATQGRGGNRTLASLYDLIKAEKSKGYIKPIGQWNLGRIVVHPDNKVEHYLNGQKVLEYQRGSQEYRGLVAQSKYKIWPNFGEAREGHILLQDHGNEVSFKNIRIKPL